MYEPFLPLLAFLLGLFSGFIGGMATGSGLISIPGLMFLGLPPSTAIATNNLNIASSLTSAARYYKDSAINTRFVVTLLAVSFLGSLFGARILLAVNVVLMQKLFGAVCIVLAILIRANKRIRRTGTGLQIIAPALIFLADVFAGMFGTGGGLLMIYILSYFYDMPLRKANANSKLIALGGTTAAILVFARAGVINLVAGVPLMIGSAIGGYIGAHTALKKEEKLVRNLLAVVAIASGIKLLV
ncbi:MAG TPA: sulfite exporter TauE/SafE family protein [Candidatus Saccharimonadales bacterium]|nr:sulfite exporter TauE/SafE family protein [Candidatus Saccharimonadales bacterium]